MTWTKQTKASDQNALFLGTEDGDFILTEIDGLKIQLEDGSRWVKINNDTTFTWTKVT